MWEWGIFLSVRNYSERRFGEPNAQEKSRTRLGMELPQAGDSPVQLTQGVSRWRLDPLRLLRLSGRLANRSCRSCILGELRSLADVPRPDISARPARPAARVRSVRCSDNYRIKNSATTANCGNCEGRGECLHVPTRRTCAGRRWRTAGRGGQGTTLRRDVRCGWPDAARRD